MPGELDWKGLSGLLAASPLAELGEIATAHSQRMALVGGAPRDALLGIEPRDVDIVAEGGFRDLLARLRERARTPSAIGDRFQDTHRFRWRGVQVDVARSLGSIEEDLRRRDFTVNSLAVLLPIDGDIVGRLIDPTGGVDDLARRQLRCADESVLVADPLRALRGVRYAATLPGFRLEATTRGLLETHAAKLAGVAGERAHGEWTLLLESDAWLAGLQLARDVGAIAPTLGEVPEMRFASAWSAVEPSLRDPALRVPGRLASLLLGLADEPRGIDATVDELVRRRWPPQRVRQAGITARRATELPDADAAELAAWALEDTTAAAVTAHLGNAIEPSARARAESLLQMAERAEEERWISGRLLRDWGMDEGPALGRILAEAARGQVTRRWTSEAGAQRWARDAVHRARADDESNGPEGSRG